MNAAFYLSTDRDVFRHAAAALRELGATYSDLNGGIVQLRGHRGRLFTVFGRIDPEAASEYLDPPDEIAPGVQPPSPEAITACLAECRDEAWFIELSAFLARTLAEPLWVLDSGGTLWSAGHIDPDRLVM